MDRAAGNDEVADIFADLNFDADPSLNGVGVDAAAPALSNRRPGAGDGAQAAPLENGTLEESFDGGAGASRSGGKTNADDNPFSFTKFLQGKVDEEKANKFVHKISF